MKPATFTNKIVSFSTLLFLTVCLYASPIYADTVQSTIRLTTDTTTTVQQTEFSPYDTIYAMITVSGLASGTYTADISWVNASGTVNQYTPVTITIAPNSPFTFYSWLRLMKNGPFKSSLTGKNFNEDFLGSWELSVSIEGIFFKKIPFTIK